MSTQNARLVSNSDANRSLRVLLSASRLTTGAILIASSLPKLRHPFEFLSAVYSYELVGAKTGMLLAMIVPYSELAVGLALLGSVFAAGALLAAIALFLTFAIAQAVVLARGSSVSCGCFTSAPGELVGVGTLLRTTAFLAIAALGYGATVALSPSRRFATSPLPSIDRDLPPEVNK